MMQRLWGSESVVGEKNGQQVQLCLSSSAIDQLSQ